MKNRNIFQQFWFLRPNYNSWAITICCYKSDGLSNEELRAVPLVQMSYAEHHQGDNWSRRKEMHQDRILMLSRANGILRWWLVLLDNSLFSTTTKLLIKKKTS